MFMKQNLNDAVINKFKMFKPLNQNFYVLFIQVV